MSKLGTPSNRLGQLSGPVVYVWIGRRILDPEKRDRHPPGPLNSTPERTTYRKDGSFLLQNVSTN